VILILLSLAACSNPDTVVIDTNIKDQIGEIEISPTQKSTQSPILVPTPLAGRDGMIAFWTTRDGNGEIYLMGADGRNQINLTNNDASELYPTWSPDGSKIAFTSDRDGDREIFVMDADGSNVIRLTDDDSVDSSPTWSPDGNKIAFASDRNGNASICVMEAIGSNVICLPNNDAFTHAYGPDWSPDGSKIVFSTIGGYRQKIYVMNTDGSELECLVDGTGNHGLPIWQP